MNGSFKVWGDYSHSSISEIWEGEMPSGDFQDVIREGYVLAHVCVMQDDTYDVGDTYSYVFLHGDYPDAGAGCSMCPWSRQMVLAGTKDLICIKVPVGIPHIWATHRDKVLADLFKHIEDSFDEDFDFDDADMDD